MRQKGVYSRAAMLYMEPALYDALKVAARDHGLSVSALIRRCCYKGLAGSFAPRSHVPGGAGYQPPAWQPPLEPVDLEEVQ